MNKIIGGKKYDTETAICVYSGDWYRGHKTEIYKKKSGEFFSLSLTQWQGEENTIDPLSLDEAKSQLENFLSGVKYESLFGEVQE